MNILYWNLNNKSNSKYIKKIIISKNIDIAIFSEFSSINENELLKLLENKYRMIMDRETSEHIFLIYKSNIQVIVKQECDRYSLFTLDTCFRKYNLVGVHLEDKRNRNNNDLLYSAQLVMNDINDLERETKCDNTIVIGDFNNNPYDSALVHPAGFNAVLFKDIINRNEYRKFKEKKFKRFYNPLLNSIREENKNYGSFYYSSDTNGIIWNSIDQVIVRKPLVDSIINVEYIRKIEKVSLITSVVPNKNISDHLPLLVTIGE